PAGAEGKDGAGAGLRGHGPKSGVDPLPGPARGAGADDRPRCAARTPAAALRRGPGGTGPGRLRPGRAGHWKEPDAGGAPGERRARRRLGALDRGPLPLLWRDAALPPGPGPGPIADRGERLGRGAPGGGGAAHLIARSPGRRLGRNLRLSRPPAFAATRTRDEGPRVK